MVDSDDDDARDDGSHDGQGDDAGAAAADDGIPRNDWTTPARRRVARFGESPAIPPTPASAAVPPTPFGGQDDDDDYDDDDDDDDDDGLGGRVPATPAARPSTQAGDDPETPLTPLSDDDQARNSNRNDPEPRHDNDEDLLLSSDDEAEQQQQHDEQHDNTGEEEDEEEAPLFGQDQNDQDLTHVRGTDVHVATAAAAFTEFLRNFKTLARRRDNDDSDDSDDDEEEEDRPPLYLKRLESLLRHGRIYDDDQQQHQHGTASLDIDTMHLYYHSEACQRFYQQLVAYPMELVPLMDLVVGRELERIATRLAQEAGLDEMPEIPQVQVRPFNLRQVSNIRCLDPVSMDSLLSVKGMIVRTSPVIPDLKVAHFGCTICGHNVQVTIDRGRIQEPHQRCPQCNTNNTYSLIHNRSVYADKQLVRLQETPDEVPAGQTPASVVTFCFDDLVDSVKPGDKVEVTGVLRAQPVRVHPKISKVKSIYKTYVDVIHFQRITGMESNTRRQLDTEEGRAGRDEGAGGGMKARFTPKRVAELKALSQRSDIYDMLTASLAPSIWELDNVKRGVLCMLFGGNHVRIKKGTAARRRRRQERIEDASMRDYDDDDDDDERGDHDDDEDQENDDGSSKLNKRGDINILLCGDPGTSKSQLLSYVNKLSARGVYTSGKGSSAVGLTASVVRDPETRDLVLESGALVLSDLGICCIDEFDKMSDTTRSVLHEAMEQQTVSIAKAGIIASLNSRTSILASANPTESRYNPSLSVVENIKLPPTLLSRFDLIYLILDSPNVDHDRRLAQHLVGLYYETPNVTEPPLDQDLLRDYIEYARENIHPELSEEATEHLIESYLEMRNPGGSNVSSNGTRTISATPRQLESLIRLSEALAKMRYSPVVTRSDTKEAVRLMKVATQAAATDPRTGRIDMDMIATGRSTVDREMEEQLAISVKELLSERRGKRMAVRDVTRQMSEITNAAVSHDEIVDVLRRFEADGILQFNERAQTVFIRTGIIQ